MNFNFDYLAKIAPLLLQGAIVTIEVTVLGTLLAAILGLGFAMLNRSRFAAVRFVTSGVVLFVRNTPLLIQLFFLYYVMPQFGLSLPALFAGVVALGVHYASYMSEVYRAGIAAVPRGQWEAAHALNMPRALTWRRVILPQALPPVIPPLGNYAIAMFKETPILATIGIMEMMGMALAEAARSYRYYEPLTMVGILFLVFSLVSAVIVRFLENRFVHRS